MSDIRDDRAALFAALKAHRQEQKKLQKSDDIITFISDHWKLFVPNKAAMTSAMASLGRDDIPYTVDALCDQLGIPENIFFKRSPVVDVGYSVLNFDKSKLIDTFINCVKRVKSGEVCLFIVAGEKSICITNMQTSFDDGRMICYYKSQGNLADIQIFKASEASVRLPTLFNQTEKGE